MKESKKRLALGGLYVGSFLTALAPIITVVALNWSTYVSTPERATSLTVGGAIAVGLLVMQVMGKTPKNVHRVVKFGLLATFCWAVNAIMDQVCLLVTCAFGGEFASWALFTAPIRRVKEGIEERRIGNAVTENTAVGRV